MLLELVGQSLESTEMEIKDRDQSLIVKLYVDRTYALCQHKRRFLSLLFVESTELTL